MTSSSSYQLRTRTVGGAALLLLLTACGGTAGDGPLTTVPKDAACDGMPTPVRTLAPLESVVLTLDAVNCFALSGGDREYLVIPQLTGASLPYGGYGFRLGDANPTVARTLPPSPVAAPSLRNTAAHPVPSAQELLDARLRAREQVSPAVARARPPVTLRVTAAQAELRTFSALNTLDATPRYSTVTARLRYAGTRVLLYMDTLTAAAFSDTELASMGALYDQQLVPTAQEAFGDGSDIDGNGRLIFLLTPTVNAMVSAAQCGSSGFVRGFFYSHDLSSDASTSNRGEIFYAFVPDATGRFSCSHSREEVLANLPPTFIHELQHLISYGEHVIERNGPAEEVWLNEGLSHMAEELASRRFEERYPAPAARTLATQLFPDSAAPYITPNLTYSYRYLFSSAVSSLTGCAPGSFCSLAERGGSWLFLRWMTDQQPAGFLRRVVETNRTGRANLEAAMGRSTAALLGDFAIAVSTDSIAGVSRNAVGPALRFSTRNLRAVYRALYDALGLPGGISRPFPIEPLPLAVGSAVTGTMRPGTFLTYRLRIPTSTAVAVFRLQSVDGSAFPVSSGAQVSVVRLP